MTRRRREFDALSAGGRDIALCAAQRRIARAAADERAVHELEQSRARYMDLYERAPVAYLTLDEQAIVREVNRAGTEMFRRPRELVVGQPISVLAELASPELLSQHLHRCESEGHAVTTELCFSANGRPFDVEATTVVVLEPCGTRRSFRTALVDVSARALAKRNARDAYVREQRLRDRLERIDEALRAMVESLASPVSQEDALREIVAEKARGITSAESSALGVAERANVPFTRWIIAPSGGPSRPEPATPPSAAGKLGDVLRTGQTIRIGDCGALPGFPSAAALLGAPVRHVQRTFGALYVARKIEGQPFDEDDALALQRFADRAALVLECALQRRRAEQAISSRDIVLATVSHDLGNPLGSIWVACDALLHDSPPIERRRARPLVEIIKRSSERMQRLIDDLLAAATLETGKLSIDRKRTATYDLLQEAARLFRPLADQKKQTLELELTESLPDVDCDRERILQVLANLVGNAIKFSPNGSRIAIAAATREQQIVVSVRDTGPGIAPEVLPQVFDRFWKGSTKARGAGLGLYVAREIVSAHDGRIWVESRPGAGATFSFELPVADRRP